MHIYVKITGYFIELRLINLSIGKQSHHIGAEEVVCLHLLLTKMRTVK